MRSAAARCSPMRTWCWWSVVGLPTRCSGCRHGRRRASSMSGSMWTLPRGMRRAAPRSASRAMRGSGLRRWRRHCRGASPAATSISTRTAPGREIRRAPRSRKCPTSARSMYPVYQPGTFVNPGYQGTLGYGFPTALGVAAGNPGRPVVSINGDGGFGWAMQELATMRKYQLNVAVVVFADGQFGNVRRFQEDQFGATYEVDLRNPAFDRLAAAFDVPFGRAESPDALSHMLGRAVRDRTPILIEAPVGPMPSPWGLMRLQARPGAANSGPPNPLGEPARR